MLARDPRAAVQGPWLSHVYLLRPRQWLKNGFVFAGILFVNHHELGLLAQAGLAFSAFCCASSAVYIFNDVCDLDGDKKHPTKRHRPLADGRVAQFDAELIMIFLVAAALASAFDLGPIALAIVVGYFVQNIAYSWWLKHVPILDAFIIANGFMLRIMIGTVAIGIPASKWLLLTGLMLTLFLAFSKRQAEQRYECQQFIAITGAGTVIAYALYTVAPETVAYHHTQALFYTVPFVMYGVCRYMMLTGDDASRHLTTDPHLAITGIGWLATTMVLCWW